MKLSDRMITESLGRLALGQFDPELDWPVCYELVRREVLRRNLPARDYAPSSQFGGTDWTTDDFTELTGEWVCLIRGDRAVRLLGKGRTSAHVANSARRSAYHFVVGKMRRTARQDVWAALRDVLPEFGGLTVGPSTSDWQVPETPFPWQETRERSAHQRAITSIEVRAALELIQSQQPSGWSHETLFQCLVMWTALPDSKEHSIDASALDLPAANDTAAADSALIGREAARTLLRKLTENEKVVLCGFIIPNGLGYLGLEQAATALGVRKSTLHDRAGRLLQKLASLEQEHVHELDAAARKAFLDEILQVSGKPPSEQSK